MRAILPARSALAVSTAIDYSGSMGRILIVWTDDQENSSTQLSKETLKAAIAADKKLLVLMMGTFFADV